MTLKKALISLRISVILLAGLISSSGYAQQSNNFSHDIQINLIERLLVENATNISGTQLYTFDKLRGFYESAGFKTYWVNNDSSAYNIAALRDAINQAKADGLIVRDYHRSILNHKILLSAQWVAMHQADSLADLDILLTDAAFRYAMDISTGQLYSQNENVNRDQNMKPFSYIAKLKLALDSGNICAWLSSLPPNRPIYHEMKNELARYKDIFANGGLAQLDYDVTDLRLGDTSQNVLKLRKLLTQTGDLQGDSLDSIMADSNVFDTTLETGIRNFQTRFGLLETGYVTGITFVAMNSPVEQRIANIMGSMERLRWLPPDTGQKYVQVNITDYSLRVMDDYCPQLKMKVIVGKPFKQTPVFQSMMKTVVINPTWEVPWSIMTDEMLPKLQKNHHYLAHNHMKIFDLKGNEINPDTVKWTDITPANFKYDIVQQPGNWNALGRIKFLFPNPYEVYLHGTPDQYLFSRKKRTFSHGCMRVEDPPALALCLLNDQGFTKKQIERKIKEGTEIQISLKHYIPVYVTYLTAWVNGNGKLCFRDDIYNRDDIFLQYVIQHPASPGI